jgi:hydrogenase maturation protein HypF
VGFRPFVFRLAIQHSLTGWVRNTAEGVEIEAEGRAEDLKAFLASLERKAPPRASIQGLETWVHDPVGHPAFQILDSQAGPPSVLITPDIATCQACLDEVFDPANRRYLYPFTNCTHCGPRFSIIESLPYDRARTTMRAFRMCAACQAEYGDPQDRRFHAQPNACPQCGPRLALWDPEGRPLSSGHEAMLEALEALKRGRIVAVKGLGGFHLMADALHSLAVGELRARKNRAEKPLALLFPSFERIKEVCHVNALEERLLRSPEAPIVFLRRRKGINGAPVPQVAPGNPNLGVMLPYTPLHHILLRHFDGPLVATSGNRSEEAICIEEGEALTRLRGLADLFLVHNRPIRRPLDDSIARIVAGRELILRRARGYAPWPILLDRSGPPLLATGGQQKTTLALLQGNRLFLTQHLGDLENAQTRHAYRQAWEDLCHLFQTQPEGIACDLHPDYASTQMAMKAVVA